MSLKDFFNSPQGAAAVTGLIRAFLIAAIGFGASITQPQVDNLLNSVTAVLTVISILMTGVTVRAVADRVEPATTTTTVETTAIDPTKNP